MQVVKGRNTHVAAVGHFTHTQLLTLLRTARVSSERDYLAILVTFDGRQLELPGDDKQNSRSNDN